MLQEFIIDVITWGNITNTLQETAMDCVLVELQWTDCTFAMSGSIITILVKVTEYSLK